MCFFSLRELPEILNFIQHKIMFSVNLEVTLSYQTISKRTSGALLL